MEIRKKNESVSCCCNQSDLKSAILYDSDFGDISNLKIVWVDLDEDAAQKSHSHHYAQLYIILDGTGTVFIGDEQSLVTKGDLIKIPPDVLHHIKAENSKLKYLTIA